MDPLKRGGALKGLPQGLLAGLLGGGLGLLSRGLKVEGLLWRVPSFFRVCGFRFKGAFL